MYARKQQMDVPAGLPAWITSELIEDTRNVWQPYYEKPLTVEDAIGILRDTGRLIHLLISKADS